MDYIYETIPLNKNLCNIIFRYVDEDLDYLIKIFKENEYKDDDIYNYENDYVLNNISLLDLIKTCLKLGFQGFYKTGINMESIHKKYKNDKDIKNGKIEMKITDHTIDIWLNSNLQGRSLPYDELITYLYYCEYKC